MEWNIQQLELAMQRDLAMCHTDFERSNVKAIGGKEIRELAENMRRAGKRVSPASYAIASKYGFK